MNIKTVSLLVISFLGVSNSAHAACSFSGKVERIYQTTSTGFIYMRSPILADSHYYRYFSTRDPGLLKTAQLAHDSNNQVNVKGNVINCPSTKMARYGSYDGMVTAISPKQASIH